MQKEDKVCNITPANRVGSVQEYYFSKKLKEVAEMNAAGKNVINLGVGSPDLPPSEQTIETLCEHARKANEHGYQPYVGIPELRKGFADWYKTWYDVDLDPKTEIQPLIGSKEGILHISLAFLNPGDGVLVPNPGYPTYSSVSKLVEARLIPYELKEELGWQPDFEELEKMDKTIVTVFNKVDRFRELEAGQNSGVMQIPRDFSSDYQVRISARTGEGLEELQKVLQAIIRSRRILLEKVFPYSQAGRIQTIRKYGQLLEEEYQEDGIAVKAYVPAELFGKLYSD